MWFTRNIALHLAGSAVNGQRAPRVDTRYPARQAQLRRTVAGPRPKGVTAQQWAALQCATKNASWK